jgi:hypothetical protein
MKTNTANKQMHRKPDKRREERVAASLPVAMARAGGITRDVSATGIFFETDAQFAKGSTIDLAVELSSPAGRMQLKCQGEIVRVEQHGTRVGVAVKITDSVLSYI